MRKIWKLVNDLLLVLAFAQAIRGLGAFGREIVIYRKTRKK